MKLVSSNPWGISCSFIQPHSQKSMKVITRAWYHNYSIGWLNSDSSTCEKQVIHQGFKFYNHSVHNRQFSCVTLLLWEQRTIHLSSCTTTSCLAVHPIFSSSLKDTLILLVTLHIYQSPMHAGCLLCTCSRRNTVELPFLKIKHFML